MTADEKCGLCGKPAEGLAMVDGVRYCHGDDLDVTCYMRAVWGIKGPAVSCD